MGKINLGSDFKNSNIFDFLEGNVLIDFNILKSHSVAAPNRDDAGEQKTARYNGVDHDRFSSQCLKRALRTSDSFKEYDDETVNTTCMPEYVAALVQEKVPDITDADLKDLKVMLTGKKPADKKSEESSEDNDSDNSESKEEKAVRAGNSSWYTATELEKFADACVELYNQHLDAKPGKRVKTIKFDEVKAIIKKNQLPNTLGIALFGRMVTDGTSKNVTAAMSVAHSLSTNSSEKAEDYFIACDDLLSRFEPDNKGGSMLGNISYNSSCFYTHASLDMEQLVANLQGRDDVEELTKKVPWLMTELFAYTDPGAHQTTFESHTLPEVIYIELKTKKRPENYMQAFATPCNRDTIRTSVNALAHHIDKVNEKFDLGIKHSVWFCMDEGEGYDIPAGATVAHSMKELQEIINGWFE